MKKTILFLTLTVVFSASVFAKGLGNNKGNGPHKAPKNIIILISDGCGYNHLDAASLFQYGSIGVQIYEDFPVICGMSTYNTHQYDPAVAWTDFNYVKNNTTDSAAAATAMSCGVKTYNSAIGVDINRQPIMHILERCEELGKATGVVTSVEWSHATPAGFVAHNKSRNNYEAIAKEMIYKSDCEVILGCGHPWFNNNGDPKSYPNTFKYVGGRNTWKDLTEGKAGKDIDGDFIADEYFWTLIQTRQEFQALAEGETPTRLCGIAQVYQTLQQSRKGNGYIAPYAVDQTETVPTLEEMTLAALNVLDNDEDGMFLMIEGGAIDWASHSNQFGRMIEEEIDFNHSVEAVIAWVEANSNWGETLVIVTGDHETGYLTGPGSNPDWMPLINYGAGSMPALEWHSSSHTNSLVPFFAKGCGMVYYKWLAENTDPVRGNYLNNTDIPNVLFDLLK